MEIRQILSHGNDLLCLTYDSRVYKWNANANDWTLFYEETSTL